MRIALSNASQPWRGTCTITQLLAEGLAARGHDVSVFCRADSELAARLPAGLCVPVLNGMDLHPGVVARCWSALRRLRPDVVVAQTDKDLRQTGVAARLLGIPVVFRQETDRPLKRALRYRLFVGWLPAHHVVNSLATARTLRASARWLRADAISVVPNGIDLARFESVEPADLGLPAGALAAGFVGRFEKRKGILELARAWPQVAAAVENAWLVIAGNGALEAEARALLGDAPRVRWLGFRRDVPELMRALTVLVVPSWFEGFGLTAVEAMAVGTPVVATDASSLAEIVRDGEDGLLFPRHDVGALAAALTELLRDPRRAARLGAAARERVHRDYGADTMAGAHERLLARFARPGGAR